MDYKKKAEERDRKFSSLVLIAFSILFFIIAGARFQVVSDFDQAGFGDDAFSEMIQGLFCLGVGLIFQLIAWFWNLFASRKSEDLGV